MNPNRREQQGFQASLPRLMLMRPSLSVHTPSLSVSYGDHPLLNDEVIEMISNKSSLDFLENYFYFSRKVKWISRAKPLGFLERHQSSREMPEHQDDFLKNLNRRFQADYKP
ncbi:hypothetical protein KSP40_PGU007269 [Platanthera guangdongensis]|uniref:Uncharacterized protein n=1 Tax=Platanthera guangdongensis TaxID=2320717 RepID=A0ABR2MM87_9ASPA